MLRTVVISVVLTLAGTTAGLNMAGDVIESAADNRDAQIEQHTQL